MLCTVVVADESVVVVAEVVVPCPGVIVVVVVGISPTATSRGAPLGTYCKTVVKKILQLANF